MKITSNEQYRTRRLALMNTGCRHWACPARVIFGGRCPKECPEWGWCPSIIHKHSLWNGSACDPLLSELDHAHLEFDSAGNRRFVSAYYGNTPQWAYRQRIRNFNKVHHLMMTIETGFFKDLNATFVEFSKAK